MRLQLFALTLLTTLLSVIHAKTSPNITSLSQNLNPTGEGCVDPAGYLSCYADAQRALVACTGIAGSTCGAAAIDICLLACGELQLATHMACWLQSCWNELNSCAYQGTAIQYLYGTDLIPSKISLPNYPAAVDAPGRCVCNIGDVFGNITAYDILSNFQCSKSIFLNSGEAFQADCTCCYESSIISNIINICPSNDLSALQITDVIEELKFAYKESASDGCSILASPGVCPATFSADTFASTFYNPGALPSGFPGTTPLSNLPLSAGQSSITVPPQGQTYVFSVFPSYVTTVVAAAYSLPAGQPGDGGTTVAGATPAPTGTGSAPASTTTKSGALRGADRGVFLIGTVAGMVMLAVACL